MVEIVENNKLIAKFMGGIFKGESTRGIPVDLKLREVLLPIHGVCRHDTIELGTGKILEYHTSWDWLMPVVKKIGETPNSLLRLYEESDWWMAYWGLEVALFDVDIEKVYSLIVEFINGHNTYAR